MSMASDPGASAAIAPPVAEQHLLDLGRRRQHRDQHLGAARAIGHVRGGSGAGPDRARQRVGVEVERGHLEPSSHEMAAHRPAHVAEPDEADPRIQPRTARPSAVSCA